MNGGKNRKKFRARVFSLVAIITGCFLVFSGYWIMQRMLDKRQDNLLSQGGSLSTAQEETEDSGQEEEERSKLTEKELSDILFRNYFVADAVPHEPYGRQMTMQEAIETGQEWVEAFCAAYAFPDENHTIQFEEVSAQLCTGEMGDESFVYDTIEQEGEESLAILYQINQENRGQQLAESMYGYWNISFSGEGIMINLNINSVSGQVLQVVMETDSYETDAYMAAMEELSLRKILQDYMNSFELEGESQWHTVEEGFYIDYEEDFRFYVWVYPQLEEEEEIPDDGYEDIYSFCLGTEIILSQTESDDSALREN